MARRDASGATITGRTDRQTDRRTDSDYFEFTSEVLCLFLTVRLWPSRELQSLVLGLGFEAQVLGPGLGLGLEV